MLNFVNSFLSLFGMGSGTRNLITIKETAEKHIKTIYNGEQPLGSVDFTLRKLPKISDIPLKDTVTPGGFAYLPETGVFRNNLSDDQKLSYIHNSLVNYINSFKNAYASPQIENSIKIAIRIINTCRLPNQSPSSLMSFIGSQNFNECTNNFKEKLNSFKIVLKKPDFRDSDLESGSDDSENSDSQENSNGFELKVISSNT